MSTTAPPRSLTLTLLPFALIVFLGYSAIGVPLSALPVQVRFGLGYGTTVVGIVVGLSAGMTLLTRQIAGALADRRGTKIAVLIGLSVTACTGVAYLLSTALPPAPGLAMLILGRLVLGLGDSLFTTGIMAWAVATVGPQHAGRAMAWIGIAMYGALAVGAPVGGLIDSYSGFAGVAGAVLIMPLLAVPAALMLPGIARVQRQRVPFLGVIRRIWPPGLSLVLASGGFGTIAAFLALRYAEMGWSGAALGLTGFGAAYITARLLFAGLPDRLGGVRMALISLTVEAAGLAVIAAAASPLQALAGTTLTGLGYSLVFPSLGVETVRRVPAESRGVALGAFLACFDLGLGAAGPAAGLLASGFGLQAAFAVAAAASVVSMVLVWTTRRVR
ncbi:MAG TPA: MFS transporter [Acetobacteraceae bacterium]|jgi:MFS family permease